MQHLLGGSQETLAGRDVLGRAACGEASGLFLTVSQISRELTVGLIIVRYKGIKKPSFGIGRGGERARRLAARSDSRPAKTNNTRNACFSKCCLSLEIKQLTKKKKDGHVIVNSNCVDALWYPVRAALRHSFISLCCFSLLDLHQTLIYNLHAPRVGGKMSSSRNG